MCMQKQLNSTNFITKDTKIIYEWIFLYKTNALLHDNFKKIIYTIIKFEQNSW